MISGMIQAWDVSSGEPLFNICGFSAGVMAVKAIGKKYLATGASDWTNNLVIWDLATSSVYRNLVGHPNPVHFIDYLTTGDLVRLQRNYFYSDYS